MSAPRRTWKPCYVGEGKAVHAHDPADLFQFLATPLCHSHGSGWAVMASRRTPIDCKRCLKAIAKLETT